MNSEITLGVVCGFEAEVNCFNNAVSKSGLEPGLFSIKASGSSAEGARIAADDLMKSGCKRLLSYGIAGGLEPTLRIGDVIFSSHVVTTLDETYGVRRGRKAEAMRLGGSQTISTATVCGIDAIACTPDEKSRLRATTHASIADMESHAVARLSHKNDIPFFVLRAISDALSDTLPAYVANAVDQAGKPRLGPVLTGLLKNPTTLPGLLRLRKNTNMALASLEEATVRLLPQFIR